MVPCENVLMRKNTQTNVRYFVSNDMISTSLHRDSSAKYSAPPDRQIENGLPPILANQIGIKIRQRKKTFATIATCYSLNMNNYKTFSSFFMVESIIDVCSWV